jgi:hypothetical protein
MAPALVKAPVMETVTVLVLELALVLALGLV